MRCLVTGGAGFIGGHLAERLVADGHEVCVVDNLSTGVRENVPEGAELFEIGLNDPGLAEAFEKAHPEFVFHLAAQVNVRRSVDDPAYDAEQNILGSARLLECCRSTGIEKFIYTSSGGACYGEPETIPAPEDTPVRPLCPYGLSKYCVEQYVNLYGRLHGMRHTTLRYANVYGPRQDPHGEAGVVAIFSETMLRGEQPRIFGDGAKTRDYVYVEDVVEANLLAVEKGDGGSYNVGTGRQITDQQVYEGVRDAVGCDIPVIYEDFRPGEVMRIALDIGLIQREFGWSPEVDFEEGIPRAVAYYRQKLGILD